MLYEISHKDGKKNHAWVEITGVYSSDDEARKAFAFAKDKNQYEPPKLYTDNRMAQKAKESILKKIKKTTYTNLYAKYGSGHLLLFIPYQANPLLDSRTIEEIKANLPLECLNQQCHFSSVWAAYQEPISDGLIIIHGVEEKPVFISLWSINSS